ncbi:MAG: hypothetical protein IJG65_07160 [Synergistaceae bacterium]|nr:hypothetical protein [Synergistaceae bacterium]
MAAIIEPRTTNHEPRHDTALILNNITGRNLPLSCHHDMGAYFSVHLTEE